MERYIIVGCSRSGTTVTHIRLKNHPNVCALNDEIRISPFFTNGLSTFTYGNDEREEKEKGYLAVFDAIVQIGKNENTLVCGLKISIIKPSDAEIFVETLSKYMKGIKIILTKREDYVAQYGSLIRAQKTGQHHSWKTPKKHIHSFRISKIKYISYLLDTIEIENVFKKLYLKNKVLEIVYEKDIIQNNYKKICNFLDIPFIKISDNSKKVAPIPENYIKNYYHLRKITDIIINNYYDNNYMRKHFQIRKMVNNYKYLKRTFKYIIKIVFNRDI